jgi:hypothetical protein
MRRVRPLVSRVARRVAARPRTRPPRKPILALGGAQHDGAQRFALARRGLVSANTRRLEEMAAMSELVSSPAIESGREPENDAERVHRRGVDLAEIAAELFGRA